MNVIHHAMLERQSNDGCCVQTVAGADLCKAPFEVQVLSVDANGRTSHETHAQTRVLLALTGSGKLLLDSGPQRFSAPCTLVIPAGAGFQLVNNAATPMQLVSVFMPPAAVEVVQP
jgi:mannose-6-phosphate isomerase-like protein (cupin superfamily)